MNTCSWSKVVIKLWELGPILIHVKRLHFSVVFISEADHLSNANLPRLKHKIKYYELNFEG